MSQATRPPIRWLSIVLAAALGLAAGCGGPEEAGAPTTLPRTASPYLNTAPDVAYIGRAACATCHEDAHASYLHTSHSRAFATVDAGEEPRGGTYRHKASGLRYTVRNDGRRLLIREELEFPGGDSEVLAEHAARWVAGSGTNSRSYVLPLAGFLVEAPVSWYASRRAWDMSPGYDKPDHDSFSRPITQECLFCHVGRTESRGGGTHKLNILEDAIGCERCHGPGELHAARWADGAQPKEGEKDFTIVNPLDLEPSAQLDLCGQCHLDHTLSVPVRGRSMEEWRPGLPMEEFRTSYRLKESSRRMSVVGHVDQLRQSTCFQESKDMSCITCHDPHNVPAEDDAKAYFRDRCLSCHAEEACGIEHTDPRRSAKADDCMACHMPRGATDIPHFSFTHHRVGLHDESSEAARSRATIHELVPAGDVSHLPAADQERNLGLAYLLLSIRRPDDPTVLQIPPAEQAAYVDRARMLLEQAIAGGAKDGAVESSLAFIYHGKGDAVRTVALAEDALRRGDALSALARVRALEVLALQHEARGDARAAIQVLQRLVTLRRSADDYGRLGAAQYSIGDKRGALASAKAAVAISPHRAPIQAFLAQAYALAGDESSARRHRRIAERLAELSGTELPR